MTSELRNISNIALTTSAMFLIVVAIALNSPVLFSMASAMLGLLAVAHVQARLSVMGLRFRRRPMPTVRQGESVQVEIEVWSDRNMRRPLVMVQDRLPEGLRATNVSPSVPVAPAPGEKSVTSYRLRPMRRGVFRWSTVDVTGSDPLGLIRTTKQVRVEPETLTVLPAPIPFPLRLPRSAGWGGGEADHGPSKGSGVDPRGIRDYQHGDSLRHVHWRSSARSGRLLVKEFEVGLYAEATVFVQNSAGTRAEVNGHFALDLLCGFAAYLVESFLGQGLEVRLPGLDPENRKTPPQMRLMEALRELSALQPSTETMGTVVASRIGSVRPGSSVYLFLAEADDTLPHAIRLLQGRGCSVFALALPPVPGAKFEACDASVLGRLRQAGADAAYLPEVTEP